MVLLELVTFGSVAPAAMLSSGCGALELRERKNERADGGAVRESSRDGERLLILLKGKKVFRWGFENFQGHICLFRKSVVQCNKYFLISYNFFN